MVDYVNIALDEGAFMPERGLPDDAGLDLANPSTRLVKGSGRILVDTGVHVEIPRGYVGILTGRSSMGAQDWECVQGTIDAGYTGSIKVLLRNRRPISRALVEGSKIAQLILVPCITPEVRQVDRLRVTERGDGGFGSTGKLAREAQRRLEVAKPTPPTKADAEEAVGTIRAYCLDQDGCRTCGIESVCDKAFRTDPENWEVR